MYGSWGFIKRHLKLSVTKIGGIAAPGIFIFQYGNSREYYPLVEKKDYFSKQVNGKHVLNSELNKYKNTDIAEYALYRLVGAGLRGKGYKYQLELATNEHFDKTYEQRVEDRVTILRHGWVVP